MMKLVLPAFAAFLVFVRATWLGDFTIASAQPDLALLVLIVFAHRYGIQRGQIAGFFIGLLQDALGGSPIGFYAVLGLSSGAIAGVTRDAFRTDSILAPPMLTIAVMIARSFIAVLLSLILGMPEVRSVVFSVPYLIEMVLNIVLAPVVFLLLAWLIDRVEQRGGGY